MGGKNDFDRARQVPKYEMKNLRIWVGRPIQVAELPYSRSGKACICSDSTKATKIREPCGEGLKKGVARGVSIQPMS